MDNRCLFVGGVADGLHFNVERDQWFVRMPVWDPHPVGLRRPTLDEVIRPEYRYHEYRVEPIYFAHDTLWLCVYKPLSLQEALRKVFGNYCRKT